jgi:hypothetical protein
MHPKPRALLAAQPAASLILRAMLDGVVDLKLVQTTSAALKILTAEPAASEVIITTIAFDDSRMIEFLYAVKSRERMSAIPFICLRVLPTVLSENAVVRVAEVCALAGAAEFIDIPRLNPNQAVALLRAAVLRHIAAAREPNRAP